MKTKQLGLFTLPVIAAIMMVGTFAPAMAEPATVGNEAGCNGAFIVQFGYSPYIPTNNEHWLATNNDNGNAKLMCHGVLADVSTAPDKADRVALDPCPFIDPNGDFHLGTGKLTVTPSGQVSLICEVPQGNN